MVLHLEEIVRDLLSMVRPSPGDLLLDIGSNDGTLLSFYPDQGVELVGMDPTADRFAKYYKPHIRRVADFFSAEKFRDLFGHRKAKIVTSIAMFYDLDRPLDFMRQVASILADDGVWHFEQSYLPAMLAAGSYDTACHEHLEYYALAADQVHDRPCGADDPRRQVQRHQRRQFCRDRGQGRRRLRRQIPRWSKRSCGREERLGLDHAGALCRLPAGGARPIARNSWACFERLKAEGRLVLGYGASTKGNVILQYCGITPRLLPCIAEVNAEKFGCFTPGTQDPHCFGNRGLGHAARLLAGAAVAFPAAASAQREAAYLSGGGKIDLSPAPDRGRGAMKRVIVVGSSGQDGAILFERLCAARGTMSSASTAGEIRCTEPADLRPVDILDAAAVECLLAAVVPDEVYYLAAFHRSAEESAADDRVEFERSFAIHVSGLLNFLAAMQRRIAADAAILRGLGADFRRSGPHSRRTRTRPSGPDCVYGISKAAGMRCVRYYRADARSVRRLGNPLQS